MSTLAVWIRMKDSKTRGIMVAENKSLKHYGVNVLTHNLTCICLGELFVLNLLKGCRRRGAMMAHMPRER